MAAGTKQSSQQDLRKSALRQWRCHKLSWHVHNLAPTRHLPVVKLRACQLFAKYF
ncbi:MAG: hypothetical protein OFPI_39370 [Osedax symbiont Rs2]|nr:MAG: hypothetical protein OFPI_39370 [Osedax symbiont Rs2]